MRLFTRFKHIFNRGLTKEQKKLIEQEEELREYNERAERYQNAIRDEEQKQRYLNRLDNIKRSTYTKRMVTAILTICIIDIQLSYILSFLGHEQIATDLSNQLCITILGVAFAYIIRAYFDSRAEHKNFDEEMKNEIQSNLTQKLNDVFEAAGITGIDVEKFIKNSTDKLSSGFHLNKPDDCKQDDEE